VLGSYWQLNNRSPNKQTTNQMNPYRPLIVKFSKILSKETCVNKQATLVALMWELHVISDEYTNFTNSLINDHEVD